MKKIEETELREIQMEMASFIDRICRKHNLEYSLGGGTLLGAVRHNGYIPWDDDIDLVMTRENYEKLLHLLASETAYKLLHYTKRKSHIPFAKLFDPRTIVKSRTYTNLIDVGVSIDIFPMDVLPGDRGTREAFQIDARKQAIAVESTGFPQYAFGPTWLVFFGKLILRFPIYLRNRGEWFDVSKKQDKFVQKYNQTAHPNLGFVASYYGVKEFFPRVAFENYEDVMFEGRTYRKIKDHGAYLSALYGNYMELPPESQRINHDYYQFYWKDK